MQKTKEITIIQSKATKAEKYAGTLVIKNDKDQEAAVNELSVINKIGDNVKEEKEKLLRPHLDGAKIVREFFKPLEEKVETAVVILKRKLIDYRELQEKEEAKEKAKIENRVEKGTLKPETAVRKLEDMGTLQKSVGSKEGSVSYKTVRKVRFIDPVTLPGNEKQALVSGGYLIWDESKARKAALTGELKIGVEIYEEKELANTRF